MTFSDLVSSMNSFILLLILILMFSGIFNSITAAKLKEAENGIIEWLSIGSSVIFAILKSI